MLWWIPAALLGFDKNWVLIAIEANLVYQFFCTPNRCAHWAGWKRFLIHRHTIAYTTGVTRNRLTPISAVFFILWDKLFGTFRAEADAGEIQYGVTRMPDHPHNPWHLQVHDWVAMFRDVRRYKDLRILYKHPDWVTERYGTPPAPSGSGEKQQRLAHLIGLLFTGQQPHQLQRKRHSGGRTTAGHHSAIRHHIAQHLHRAALPQHLFTTREKAVAL